MQLKNIAIAAAIVSTVAIVGCQKKEEAPTTPASEVTVTAPASEATATASAPAATSEVATTATSEVATTATAS